MRRKSGADGVAVCTHITDDLLARLDIRHDHDVPLGPMTWYGIGGCAAIVAHPASVAQLAALVSHCHEHDIRVYVLGSGANLLIADEGVDGVVIRLDTPAFGRVRIDDTRVIAGAGSDLMKLVLDTTAAGLGGLEVLAGIPATVGGAARMNAGGAFGEIGNVIDAVHVMDKAGHAHWRRGDELSFSYRSTNITEPYILDVEFALTRDTADALRKRVKEIFEYKKRSQPMAAHSPGCAFKNPSPPLAASQPPPPDVNADTDADPTAAAAQSAGRLIDRAGLKGYRRGGAEVCDRHANFIIAHHGTTAADVRAVLEHVEQTVDARFGVRLEREIVLWP
jgi:UDP-N-acetylmuramate dehydrogenase